MKTNIVIVRGASNLCDVIRSRYGVSALDCDALTIEWAATHMVDTTFDAKAVAKEWRALNAKRVRLGKHTGIPAYGTALFAAFF